MSVFNALGYDRTVTFFKYNAPESRDDGVTYTPITLRNCQVVYNYRKTVSKDGKENASSISVAFLIIDNPDADITEDLVGDSFFVLGEVDGSDIENVTSDFADYVKNNYDDVFTLLYVKKELKVLPHYEFGGG